MLDEPLSNLDAERRDRMRDEIRQWHQQLGINTVFVGSYDLDASPRPGEAVFVDAEPGAAILVDERAEDARS